MKRGEAITDKYLIFFFSIKRVLGGSVLTDRVHVHRLLTTAEDIDRISTLND